MTVEPRRFEAETDVGLLDGVKSGNSESLAELWHRHAPSVLHAARGVRGSRGGAEAIVQEVFLRLWREPQRFETTRGNLRVVLAMDARGRSTDMTRADSARTRRETRTRPLATSAADPVYEEICRLELNDGLRAGLAILSDCEREAIVLAYFGHLSYQATAAHLGVAEATVKSRIRTGLHRLHDHLS